MSKTSLLLWGLAGWYIGYLTGNLGPELTVEMLFDIRFYAWLILWPVLSTLDLLARIFCACNTELLSEILGLFSILGYGIYRFVKWNWA